jgi:hypothetical protein
MTIADKELTHSSDPSLVMAGGMMHFCAGDNQGARRLFGQSLSMDPENALARLMLFMIDWLTGRSSVDPYHEDLLGLDWRSPAEFMGYLFRILEGLVDEKPALEAWYNQSEKSWVHYVVGLLRAKRGEWAESEELLRQAVLAAEPNSWEFFLSRAELDQIQKRRLDALQTNVQWTEYQAEIESFSHIVQRGQAAKEASKSKLAELKARLDETPLTPKDKREVLEKILQSSPENQYILVALTFYSSMEEAWEKALEYARAFRNRKGRENAGRLSVGLMEAEILHHMGREDEAGNTLESYGRLTRDPWYRAMSECLLGKRTEESLKKEAGKSPENLLTLHAALGFWAEGSGDKEKAIEHYKEALESFLDDRLEFSFARERIKSLRRPSG